MLINSFETIRLFVTSLSLDDAEFIKELVNTPDWLKFIGDRKIKTLNDAETYINRIAADDAIHFWTMKEKETSKPIGILTLIKRAALDYPDFGFALLPEYYGKGYASEAASKMLQLIAAETDIKRLLAITKQDNTSSIALLEKLGFIYQQQSVVNSEPVMLYAKEL